MKLFLDDLNSTQQEIVKTINGPILVLAGAGSGKTKLFAKRIAYLIQIGIPPQNILGLTFLNKMANEVKECIYNFNGKHCGTIWIGTFYSIFANILRKECDKIGYQKNFIIYNQIDSLGLIKKIIESRGISTCQFSLQFVYSKISNLKNRLATPVIAEKYAKDDFEVTLAKIYLEYQRRLRQLNAMDFDDLLVNIVELFERDKSTLKKYQDTFRYILVDEYQETNKAQYLLLNQLVAMHKNICVMGDDAQSIYGFRGADTRNINHFIRDYPNAKIFRLEQNYRSTKTILDAASRVIQNNKEQIPKILWTSNTEGFPITIIECIDENDEAEQIVSLIIKDCTRFKMDLSDFAVLYRTQIQSKVIEDVFKRKNIPYKIIDGSEYYKRKGIRDALAYLKVLVNPADDENFLNILSSPQLGMSIKTIRQIEKYALRCHKPIFQVVSDCENISTISKNTKEKLLSFVSIFNKYAQIKGKISLEERIRAFIEEIGILRFLKEEGTPDSLERRKNIQELLSSISEYSVNNPGNNLEHFLEYVCLLSDIDQWDPKRNVVNMMTLHCVKGLEFPVVYITGLEEGLLPYYNKNNGLNDLEEERRLCYVGITRTMKKLYLSYALSRCQNGNRVNTIPSRFIDEIKGGNIETIQNNKKSLSQSMKKYESTEMQVGALVYHKVFGKGKIISLSEEDKEDRAVVDFQIIGKKTLLLKYAQLKIIDS